MGSRAGNGLRDGSGQQVEKEDTLKYLSQLETVARRLKDQLLSDRKKVFQFFFLMSKNIMMQLLVQ
jgi:hypothetical protein